MRKWRFKGRIRCALLLCAFADPVQTRAQENAQDIRLAGTVELARCLDLIALDTGKTITYDPGAIRGMTVSVRGGIDDLSGDFLPIVHARLRSIDFALVPLQNASSHSVVTTSEAADLVSTLDAGEFTRAEGALQNYWRVRIPTGLLDPAIVESVLPRIESTQQTRVSQRSGRDALSSVIGHVIVSGYTDQIAETIEKLDVLRSLESTTSSLRISVPKGSAARTIEAVRSLVDAESSLSARSFRGTLLASPDDSAVIVVAPEAELAYWERAVTGITQPEEVRPEQYSVDGLSPRRLESLLRKSLLAIDPGSDDPRVLSNPITGSLTIWTTAANHVYLADLVEEMTNPSPSKMHRLATIAVTQRDIGQLSEQVERALAALTGFDEDIMRPDSGLIETDRLLRSNPLSPPEQSAPSRVAAVSIDADEATNSLIVIGTPIEIEQVRALVDELDVPTTQVQLEVLLLSLSESETFDLGIELTKVVSDGDTVYRLSSLFGLGQNAGAAALPGAGAGVTGVVLDPGDFATLVQALETINEGRSLSMPSVLVANNQTADFNSVLQQPVVSINASDTVATTSFGGFEDAGTNVSVDPQILAGDRLNLNYSVTLSSFVGDSSDPSVPPPRQQNQLSSAVTIPDGHTVALGGIELTTEGYAESRVPLVGSVPWLGELFKTRSRTNSRTRFYVFIRANIHRDPMLERLKYTSERMLEEHDLPTGWPEIRPRIIH